MDQGQTKGREVTAGGTGLTLHDAIAAAGMTPPKVFREGRWLRFPGVGKGRNNRAGWCRIISPTLAIYGDFSSNLRATWTDANHRNDETTERLLKEARERERQFYWEQRERQRQVAKQGEELLNAAHLNRHPYLAAKGFPDVHGLCFGDQLLVPVRDVKTSDLISVQNISPKGEKKFMVGSRARGGIHRLGAMRASHTVLCEGYATGLSLYEAAKRLWRDVRVVVCFSAGNLECVAREFCDAIVAADHDASGVGERTAKATGKRWIMPPEVGDFNDVHVQHGLVCVVQMLRKMTMNTS